MNQTTIEVFIIVVLLMIFIGIWYFNDNNIIEDLHFIPNTYYTTEGYETTKAMKEILHKNGIYRSPKINAMLYIPYEYDYVQKYYDNLILGDNYYVYAVSGCNNIAGKNLLWKNIKEYYSRNEAKKIMPDTYLLNDYDDCITFLNNITNFKRVVIKKNIQRQEGVKIVSVKEVDSISKIERLKQENYILLQEYLHNPYIVNKRKINLRIYLLIVINESKTFYIYPGFMYYTQEHYNPNSNDFKHSITTGYVDRQVYAENPLTVEEFYNTLNENTKSIIKSNIKNLFKKVCIAIKDKICKTKGKVNFQLFGCDVHIDATTLNAMLIEINKGPSLVEMDERDAEFKYKLQQDMLELTGLITKTDNNKFECI